MPSYERQQARLYAPGQQRQIINDLRASDITSVESATPKGWRWPSHHVRPSEAMLSGVDAPPAPRDARNPETRPDSPSRRSEEHTSELQSLMRISSAVLCLKKKKP